MNKEQHLTFNLGITNVPSDATCDDNALEKSEGFVFNDGEHHVIQKPSVLNNLPNLVFIHKTTNGKNYIGIDITTNYLNEPLYRLYYNSHFNIFCYLDGGDIKIQAIGNTLIINDGGHLKYALWKGDSYTYLGDSIPEPTVYFRLKSRSVEFDPRSPSVSVNSSLHDNMIFYDSESYGDVFETISDSTYKVKDDKHGEYDNLLIGLYRKLLNDASEKKRFTRPFFARYAVRLYDGSYAHVSEPFPMFASITDNLLYYIRDSKIHMAVRGVQLIFFSQDSSTGWGDIVKGIDIFVSEQTDIYDITEIVSYRSSQLGGAWSNGIHDDYYNECTLNTSTQVVRPEHFLPLGQRVKTKLFEKSRFYKVAELNGTNHSSTNLDNFIDKYTLGNITTQTRLPSDDYFSRSLWRVSSIFTYNKRLFISGVERSLFEGLNTQPLNGNSGFVDYCIITTININGSQKKVKHFLRSQLLGHYYYYPDSRATHVVIYDIDRSVIVLDADLRPFEMLNGAYYMDSLGSNLVSSIAGTSYSEIPSVESNIYERLSDHVISSEVNNPFVFSAKGYFTVDNGNVLAISTITQALSQNKFGDFPLIIFTDCGIWSASFNDEGFVNKVAPLSREVCDENKLESITQTDNAVFFLSEKGLMRIDENGQVLCVSKQLNGKGTPLSIDFMAYDYRDSLLWLFESESTTCYIYSLIDGTFGTYILDDSVKRIVNDYPDSLLVTDSDILSLIQRANINDDEREYAGEIVSRPIKFENGLALKSLRDLKLIKDMQEDAHVTVTIQASNDLRTWKVLKSFRGMPYKYFKIGLAFSDMKATDRFAGLVAITQERRTNKLR